jgi:spermidine/putrescine transport system permease protein
VTATVERPAPVGTASRPPARRRRRRVRVGSVLLVGWAILGLVYLFIPIVWIVIFSFNQPKGRYNLTWQQFTLQNWLHPFGDPQVGNQVRDAFITSLKVGLLATAVAAVLGTLMALSMVKYRFRGGGFVNSLVVLPLTTPEVVLGSSLLTLFLGLNWDLGFVTVFIAHVMFCVSYVALTVRARIRGFDWTLEDAAMDLGAPPGRTFRKVTLPLIIPGVIAAALLSLALSIDDFIITYFNAGTKFTTFPIFVWGVSQRGLPPAVNVIGSFILFTAILVLGMSAVVRVVRDNRGRR